MKLTYLGTAAAEGWPAVFCACEHCVRARQLGGKNLRTRSQAIIDGKLLIDFPIDTYFHALMRGIDLSRISNVIITHTHSDHFSPFDLEFKGGKFSGNRPQEALRFWGSAEVGRKLSEDSYLTPQTVKYGLLPLFKPTVIDGYEVTALRANHKYDETAHVYRVAKDGKSLLYLHDTGYLFTQTIEYLESLNSPADLVSFDCTYVKNHNIKGHMGFYEVIALSRALKDRGIITDDTRLVVNHFSHNGAWDHETLCARAEKFGFEVSYDGMTVEV